MWREKLRKNSEFHLGTGQGCVNMERTPFLGIVIIPNRIFVLRFASTVQREGLGGFSPPTFVK